MPHANLTQLGMSKNEADIYRTLLEVGESNVKQISGAANVNRRNAYDVLNRLMEKGLVFIVLKGKEHYYQAVNPNKLTEFIDDKKNALRQIMPELKKLTNTKPTAQEVMIYRGLEGWKNTIKDVVMVGQDLYTIGAKGAWTDERLKATFNLLNREVTRKKIKIYLLCDYEIKAGSKELLKNFSNCEYAFLPKGYPTSSAIDVFGDRVVIVSYQKIATIDENTLFVVIINQEIADAFRTWFRLMWDISKKKSRA